MNTTKKILETYRRKLKARTWAETAESLGLSYQGLVHIRNGAGTLKGPVLEKLASVTGYSIPEIWAIWQAEHGETETLRNAWKKSKNHQAPPWDGNERRQN